MSIIQFICVEREIASVPSIGQIHWQIEEQSSEQ